MTTLLLKLNLNRFMQIVYFIRDRFGGKILQLFQAKIKYENA